MTAGIAFNFLTLSSVSWEKGPQDFAVIAHATRSIFSQDRFVWIGTGQVPDDLQHQKEVIFTGFLPEQEKQDLFKKVNNIFILCSRFEGFSVPIAEACLYEIPVICYRIPEIESAYRDHLVYVERFDVGKFIRKCSEVRENYREYCRKARKARAFVIENYSESAFLQRVAAVLE